MSLTWIGYVDWAIYVPTTGRLMEGWGLDKVDGEAGVGWCWEVNMTRSRTVIHDDGTVGGTYIPANGWEKGRVLVWSTPTTLACIDQNENVLWTCPAPGNQDNLSFNGDGDRTVVSHLDGRYWVLIDGNFQVVPEEHYPILLRWSTNYICGQNGYYTLYDKDRNVLYGPHINAMFEVGQDLYARWINDWTYEYFRCAPGGKPEVLFTVYTVGGRPGDLPTDGAGVYALRTDTREITVFDRFGDTLGVIETDFDIDIYTDITFEHGCVRVEHTYATDNAPEQSALYLPTGEKVG